VETAGGLLAQRLGRVPIAGSTATIAGLRLTAESLAGRRNRISTVTVQRVRENGAGREAAADQEPPADDPGDDPGDEQDNGQWAWAADDIPGQPAAEIASKAADLDDRRL
jgi:hypothetical protein